MKLTRWEKSWLHTFGILTVALAAIFFVRPLLPTSSSSPPLADPTSLKLLASGERLPTPPAENRAEFHGTRSTPPKIASDKRAFTVLGASQPDAALPAGRQTKRIEVNLTNQKVYAFEGDRQVFEFVVSTGKWAPTPTGTFQIWAKVRSQKMSGGNRAWGTYYYLPNVPYVMFFYNGEVGKMRGFSLHGTYWHENFGHPMSHGCINMKIADAAILYDWADPPVTNPKAWSTLASAESPGTPVVIYGETPNE